jgi:hypothetical protein
VERKESPMADPHIVLGVHITNRLKNAVEVQKVFTEYGCNIKTRIGLHDVSETVCGPSGVVLIEFFGAVADAEAMNERLCAIEGVQVQSIIFDH